MRAITARAPSFHPTPTLNPRATHSFIDSLTVTDLPAPTKWRRTARLSRAARPGACAVAPPATEGPLRWRIGLKVDWRERGGRAQPIGTAQGQRSRLRLGLRAGREALGPGPVSRRTACCWTRPRPVFFVPFFFGLSFFFSFMFALCSLLLLMRWSLSFIKGACGSLNLLEVSKEDLRALTLSHGQEEILQAWRSMS